MPFRSPIFRKLLLSSFLLIFGTVVVLDFYVTRYISGRELETAGNVLQTQVRILAGELPSVSWTVSGPGASLQPQVALAGHRHSLRRRGARGLGARSREDGESRGRPEIREAFAGREGKAIRHSATIRRDLLYFAVPASIDGQSGLVLRLAMPLRVVDESIAEVRWRIFRGSLIAALIALLAAYFFSRSLTKRIRTVQSFAEGLVNDRFSETLTPGPDDEIGSLSRSLNDMAANRGTSWHGCGLNRLDGRRFFPAWLRGSSRSTASCA